MTATKETTINNEPNPEYIAAWDDLRARQQWFFVAWLGGFVSVALLWQIRLLPSWIAPIGYAVAFFYTGDRWSSFPCPRCWEPFFKTSWSVNQFRKSCPHCGLRKYAETDADEETRYLRMYEQ